jgi:hypothetical protein
LTNVELELLPKSVIHHRRHHRRWAVGLVRLGVRAQTRLLVGQPLADQGLVQAMRLPVARTVLLMRWTGVSIP